jgi:Ni/Co efflux regulator RcnB
MNSKKIICSIAIASLGWSSVAFAQPARHDQRDWGHDQRRAQHERRDERREAREERREAREDRREARYYYNARGPEFRRGGRLPPEYRNRQYVVTDWRGHRLSAPPRGYQWVQVGPDYVLAAVATGIIANLILSR